MFQFFLAFVFAVTVYDVGPPPSIGVSNNEAQALKNIDFLKTCYGLDWHSAKKTEGGISFQIKDCYTVCQSIKDGKTWLTCLVGNGLAETNIEAGVSSLLAEYNKVFDPQDALTDYAKAKCRSYNAQQTSISKSGANPASLFFNATDFNNKIQTILEDESEKSAEIKTVDTKKSIKKISLEKLQYLTTVSTIPLVIGPDGQFYTIESFDTAGFLNCRHPLLNGEANDDPDMQRKEVSEELAGYFEDSGNGSEEFKTCKLFLADSKNWQNSVCASADGLVLRASWYYASANNAKGRCHQFFYTRRGILILPWQAFGPKPPSKGDSIDSLYHLP